MKLLKHLFIALVLSATTGLVVALFLPASAHVERSTFIQAPPSTVFALLNDFREFNRWSPWAKLDADTRYTFEGPPTGTGARMTWHSEHPGVGSGSQQIVASSAPRRVEVVLEFGDQDPARAYYDLQALGGGTQVTWGFDSEFGYNLVGRYFGLLLDGWIGADYEKGLANLKVLAEGQAGTD